MNCVPLSSLASETLSVFIYVDQECVTEIQRPFPERFRSPMLFSASFLLPEEAPAVAVAFVEVKLLNLLWDQFAGSVVMAGSLLEVRKVVSGSACW